MLFLINDTILDLDTARILHPLEAARFEALGVDFILQLGCELFAADPMVHKTHPERVRRLLSLIALKMPAVNAVEFFVSSNSGRPQDVMATTKVLHEVVLQTMAAQQQAGQLDLATVDKAVWHRRAA
ncbi:MAG: hypothetical protein ACK41P_08985 [Asticcacaulis sp.]